VNASIAAGNAASPKLNKGKPNPAPVAKGMLDANGEIPEGVGNPQVRQFANDLINDRDVDKIPQKARASAEALARQYAGWQQGAFTPREQKQMLVSKNFLEQLQKSDALKVLDSYTDRILIARVLEQSAGKGPSGLFNTIVDQVTLKNLPARDAEFIKLFNAAAGSVQGLSAVTRQGRATMGIVNMLKQELPNILQSSSSEDAKGRISQLLKEVELAQKTNKELRMEGGPASSNMPKVGAWKPPADAPPPTKVGQVLKVDGNVIAKSDDGKTWSQP